MHASTRGLSALTGVAMLLASTPARAAEPSADPGALPSYSAPVAAPFADPFADGAEPPEQPRLVEVPPDGRGRQAVGGFALVGAAAVGAGTVVLMSEGFGSDVWGPTLLLTVGVTVAGSLLVWDGRRRGQRYRSWADTQDELPPAQGNGVVAAGGTMVIAGAAAGMFGTIAWVMSGVGYNPDGSTISPVFPTMLGLGLASVAAGTATLAVGTRRHRRFQAWRQARPLEISPMVAPIGAPLARGPGSAGFRAPVGGQIGVVGRF